MKMEEIGKVIGKFIAGQKSNLLLGLSLIFAVFLFSQVGFYLTSFLSLAFWGIAIYFGWKKFFKKKL
ncbi:MAG: hypothetical protein ACKO96_48865, partial [Flammeovirgaceae bacterium]